jgi:recombination protein RecT
MPPPEAPEQTTALTLQDQIVGGLQAHKGEVKAFLPNEDAQRRFMRIILRALDESPRLRQATPDSIVRAAVEAAMYGLEPSGAIGGAHLVPFKNSESNQLEAQLITDYRGDIHLARQSKEVVDAYAEVVYKADRFVDDRAQANVIHEPDLSAPRTNNPDHPDNPIIAVYACIVFATGYRRFVVMTKEEIEAIRAMAPGKNSPAWRNHWPEMGKKTVLKRGLKTAPLPPMVRSLISREDTLDYTQPIQATVEQPRGQALAERLQQRIGTTEQPEQGEGVPPATPAQASQPAASVAGEGAPVAPDGEAEDARTAASPTTPDQQGSPTETSVAGTATEQADEARQPAPATTLTALRQAPSRDTFLAFALEVLGQEGKEIADLTAEELDEVIDAAVDSEDEWAVLYSALPAVVKAQLRAKAMHPKGRLAAKELPNHPNAEQLKAALGAGDPA